MSRGQTPALRATAAWRISLPMPPNSIGAPWKTAPLPIPEAAEEEPECRREGKPEKEKDQRFFFDRLRSGTASEMSRRLKKENSRAEERSGFPSISELIMEKNPTTIRQTSAFPEPSVENGHVTSQFLFPSHSRPSLPPQSRSAIIPA